MIFVEVAPVGQRARCFDGRGRLSESASGMVFVKLHGAAGTVDDEHARGAGGFEHLVHPRRHLRDAPSCVWTGVVVPHVADDDRGLLGIPLLVARESVVAARLWRRFLSRAKVKLKWLGAGTI